jgi:hypothetical protein
MIHKSLLDYLLNIYKHNYLNKDKVINKKYFVEFPCISNVTL